MTHERETFDAADGAALYAAGALSAEESAWFESRLVAADADCLAEFNKLDSVIAWLLTGIDPVPANPQIRDRLLKQVAQQVSTGAAPLRPAKSQAAPEPAPTVGKQYGGVSIQYARTANWESTGISGVTQRILDVDHDRGQYTALIRCAAGVTFPPHRHTGLEQTLVLEGEMQMGEIELGPGDYQRADRQSKHVRQFTRGGCLLLVIAPIEQGHVAPTS